MQIPICSLASSFYQFKAWVIDCPKNSKRSCIPFIHILASFLSTSLLILIFNTFALAQPSAESSSIILGIETPLGEAPWMVALEEVENGAGFVFCGGVLIHPNYVATAAHCVVDFKYTPESLKVVFTSARLSDPAAVRVNIKGIIIHPLYSRYTSYANDVALLKLESPVTASPLPLISSQESELWAPGRPAKTYGWGITEQLILPDELRTGEVEIDSDEACLAINGRDFTSSSMLCTAGSTQNPDFVSGTCNGDSGGPLVVLNAQGEPRLIGLTSWGIRCGSPLYRDVFVRVAAFVEFLNSAPAAPPFPLNYPRIDGETKVGHRQTCIAPIWAGEAVERLEYQWLREPAGLGFFPIDAFPPLERRIPIAGATSSSYWIRPSDIGYSLACEIRASNTGGTFSIITSSIEGVGPDSKDVSKDKNPPKLKFLGKSCSQTECILRIELNDEDPKGVYAVAVKKRDALGAIRSGRSKTPTSLNYSTTTLDGVHWTLNVARPKREVQTIKVFAKDHDGNKSKIRRVRIPIRTKAKD